MVLADVHEARAFTPGRVRRNPHEAKENIHFRLTSISHALFGFFSFSGTSVSFPKRRDTGAAQKQELDSPIQRAFQEQERGDPFQEKTNCS